MEKLKTLFDLSTVENNDYQTRFEEIAEVLFSKHVIQIADGSTYRFVDIEFYYSAPEHPDFIVHPRASKSMRWYINDFGGIDINFESNACKSDPYNNLCSKYQWNPDVHFGGILIRQLLAEGNGTVLDGPLKVAELFRDLGDVTGCVQFPTLVRKTTISYDQPQRYIRHNLVSKPNDEESFKAKLRNIRTWYSNAPDLEVKEYIDKGMDVVYVGIGSTLSSAFQAAFIAKQSFPEGRVALIDSKNLSTSSAILAIHAAKLRDEGKSATEIAEAVQKLVPNVIGQFAVEEFEYLYKGGRCSGAAKVVGSLLHIRPLLKVIDGKLVVYKKPRGPMKVAINEQIAAFKAELPNIDQTVLFITHTGMAPGMVEWVKEELSKLVNPECIEITTAGAVIGSHCGPGTLGIMYLLK